MIKVFLVEDEKIIRKSIKNNVKWEENGFEFAGEAPDGEMALPMIEKLHPDIVITDIKMPFMDGLELSDILKKKMPKIQIIILSGYGEFDYAKEAIKIGVTDYLTKPVTGEQLLEALNKVKQKLDKKKRQEEDIKKLQKNIKTQMKNMRYQFFGNLIRGKISVSKLMEQGNELGIDLMAPETEELPRFKLVATMMGKEFDDLADIKGSGTSSKKQSDEVVIEAKGLYHKGTIKPFDIKIHKGEVVGLSGLLGSGRSELVRAIYGADKPDGGELYVKGEKLDVKAPIDAMHQGMAYCPEDRKVEGIIADLSVRENMILALQAKRGMFKLMSRKEQEELTDKYIKMLQVKTASRETPIKSLSGGNQQKVILGRWLMTEPDFLILDEPTRGIDVGTKTEIQKLVVKLANEGMSVVFISSEVEEMLRTVTHMGILRDGEKVGELEESELSQENVMKAIAGGDK